jgi:hypothetical protein
MEQSKKTQGTQTDKNRETKREREKEGDKEQDISRKRESKTNQGEITDNSWPCSASVRQRAVDAEEEERLKDRSSASSRSYSCRAENTCCCF